MTFKDKIFLAVVGLIILGLGIAIGALGGKWYSPVSRSAVYELPIRDKGPSWKITSYKNKAHIMLELPAMPEEQGK